MRGLFAIAACTFSFTSVSCVAGTEGLEGLAVASNALCGLIPGAILEKDLRAPRVVELSVENARPRPGESAFLRGRIDDDGPIASVTIDGTGIREQITELTADGRFTLELPIDACSSESISPTAVTVRDRAGRESRIDFTSREIDFRKLRIEPILPNPRPSFYDIRTEPTETGFNAIFTAASIDCPHALFYVYAYRAESCRTLVRVSDPMPARSGEIVMPVELDACAGGGEWVMSLHLGSPFEAGTLDSSFYMGTIDLGPGPSDPPKLDDLRFDTEHLAEGTVVRISTNLGSACPRRFHALLELAGNEELKLWSPYLVAEQERAETCVAIPSSAPDGEYRLAELFSAPLGGCAHGIEWSGARYTESAMPPVGISLPDEAIVFSHPN